MEAARYVLPYKCCLRMGLQIVRYCLRVEHEKHVSEICKRKMTRVVRFFLVGKVVEKCDITYSMLSTPEAASDVFYDAQDGVLVGLTKGKKLVDCATLQVEVSHLFYPQRPNRRARGNFGVLF